MPLGCMHLPRCKLSLHGSLPSNSALTGPGKKRASEIGAAALQLHCSSGKCKPTSWDPRPSLLLDYSTV